jgi:hypothetical protein
MKMHGKDKEPDWLGACGRLSPAARHKCALAGVERYSSAGTCLAGLYHNGTDMSSFKACLEHMSIAEMLLTAKAVIGTVILAPIGSAPIHTESIVTCHRISRRIRHARYTLLSPRTGTVPASFWSIVTLPCIVEKETRNVNAKYYGYWQATRGHSLD